jgi:hypothetical protein
LTFSWWHKVKRKNEVPEIRNTPTEWVKWHSPGNARGKYAVFRPAPEGGEMHHSINGYFLIRINTRLLNQHEFFIMKADCFVMLFF